MAAVVTALVFVGGGEEAFGGGGTWQSLLFAVLEALVMVTMSVWLVDLFRRRVVFHGPLALWLAGAAYAAFFVHQGVLVLLILGGHPSRGRRRSSSSASRCSVSPCRSGSGACCIG